MTRGRQIGGLVAWIAVTFVAAAIGGAASADAEHFYQQLGRPAWSPPASVFGPVWTILYALMAVAAWFVWREGGFKAARIPLVLFLVQLAVNVSWSWFFFAWQLGAASTAVIVILLALIVATLVTFWRVRPLAGALLIPYLAWVTFAMFLNFTVWRMNPELL
jgi:tryptophan-rich sensory protein